MEGKRGVPVKHFQYIPVYMLSVKRIQVSQNSWTETAIEMREKISAKAIKRIRDMKENMEEDSSDTSYSFLSFWLTLLEMLKKKRFFFFYPLGNKTKDNPQRKEQLLETT